MHKMTMSAVSPTHSYVELDSKTVKQQREDANLVRIGMHFSFYSPLLLT